MSRNLIYSILLLLIGAIIGGVASIFLFLQITGGNAEVSEPITAPTLSLDNFQPTPVVTLPVIEAEPTQPTEPTPLPTAIVEVLETSSPMPTETFAPPPTATAKPPQLFRIDATRSKARFSVYETFPEGTAVGETNQIAGDLIIDHATPSNSQVGTIRINLRALQTDDPKRDQSIRCCVLLTSRDEYEFGEFTPTQINGLPDQITLGEQQFVQIVGDLTIRGVTNAVTFDATLNLANETELFGLATAQVSRKSFGILNNDDNGFDYHGVVDEITLDFEFVAIAVQSE